MNYLGICGAGICVILMALILRNIQREQAQMLILAAGLFFFGLLLSRLKDAVEYVKTLAALTPHLPYVGTLIKALGIAWLTEMTHEIAKACGESGVAGYVEALGKAEILVLCLPLIEELTDTALKFL